MTLIFLTRKVVHMLLLRFGSSGEEVAKVKSRLLVRGCYAEHIRELKTSVFGRDTQRAVKKFQIQHGLVADGIVGPLTYAALFPEEQPEIIPAADRKEMPAQIGDVAAQAILTELAKVSDKRRRIVLDALQFAYDQTRPSPYPTSLYIRGGNLYNTDLSPNVITLDRIASGARRQPEYYDGGRKEMMELTVMTIPTITGADCSGGVVGLLRHAGVVKPTFDLSADGFAANSSYKHIDKSVIQPGDLPHKSGHIGIYVGGGYVVEWMGGAYGCQLTQINARRGWNFVKHKEDRFGAWTAFLRPKFY